MKRILVIAALIVTVTSLALSQAKDEKAAQSSRDEQEVKQVIVDLGKAVVARDVEAIERLVADDYTFTQPDTNISGKAKIIEIAKTGSFIYESHEPVETKVRFYGDTAVINGRFKVAAKINGQSVSEQIRFTAVCVKQKGRWQIAALHSTFIPPQLQRL